MLACFLDTRKPRTTIHKKNRTQPFPEVLQERPQTSRALGNSGTTRFSGSRRGIHRGDMYAREWVAKTYSVPDQSAMSLTKQTNSCIISSVCACNSCLSLTQRTRNRVQTLPFQNWHSLTPHHNLHTPKQRHFHTHGYYKTNATVLNTEMRVSQVADQMQQEMTPIEAMLDTQVYVERHIPRHRAARRIDHETKQPIGCRIKMIYDRPLPSFPGSNPGIARPPVRAMSLTQQTISCIRSSVRACHDCLSPSQRTPIAHKHATFETGAAKHHITTT